MFRIRIVFVPLLSLLLLAACSPTTTRENSAQQLGTGQLAASKWEGQLIRRPGDTPEDQKVYLVKSGKKQWVISADWLKRHGYKFPEDVKLVSAEELAAIPQGDAIQ